MNTKRKLNCYVFSNLIVGFLSLILLNNNSSTELIKKTSSNTLNKIYEKKIVEEDSISDVLVSDSENPSVVSLDNSSGTNYTFSYVKPSYNSLTGTNLVNYAKQFLGLKYVYAGRSLATGTDCSGFTSLIYQEFGITLGKTVASQLYSGTYVSKEDLQPGDLVFYSYGTVASHVAIYMGDGLIIHESTPRYGVKISSVNIMNYITARRLITADVVSKSFEVVTPVVEETPVNNEVNNTNTVVPDTTLETTDTNEENIVSENELDNENIGVVYEEETVEDENTSDSNETSEPVVQEVVEPSETISETTTDENSN